MSRTKLETEFYQLLEQKDMKGAKALMEANIETIPEADQANPFSPSIRLKVVSGDGSSKEGLVRKLIAMSRAWRNTHYEITLGVGYQGLRLLEEGDSWHQYPVLLNDIVDVLMQRKYAVASLSAAGDTAEQMDMSGEYVHAIRKFDPDVFLISAGGNDLLGGGRFKSILKPYHKGKTAHELISNSAMDAMIKGVIVHYKSILSKALTQKPELQICIHGYDYVHPLSKGKWLGKPLKAKGIPLDVGRDIAKILLDEFNKNLMTLAQKHPNNVHYIDLRNTADQGANSWHDELHPRNPGFKRAAQKVIETLEQINLAEKQPLAATFEATGIEVGPNLNREAILRKLGVGTVSVRQSLANPRPDPIGMYDLSAIDDLEILLDELDQPEDKDRTKVRRNYSLRYTSPAFERILGDDNLDDFSVLSRGVKVGESVARLFIRGPSGENGYGTGFLIGGNLMLTNNHVFPTAAHAKDSIASFRYELGADNILRQPIHFLVTPEIFLTSAENDYSIVSLAPISASGARLSEFGYIELLPESGKVLKHEYINIIQHPGGNFKQVALRNNQVLGRKDQYLYYSTDTMPGSSGSPVFNEEWQLAGLHHMAVPDPHEEGKFIANRGIRISSILADVIQQRNMGNSQAKQVDSILQEVRNTPPDLGNGSQENSQIVGAEKLQEIEVRLSQIEQAQMPVNGGAHG